jgi:hypothetical protein
MAQIGDFFLIDPSDWYCQTHGDVMGASSRAAEYKK